jgi:hypothetical protein
MRKRIAVLLMALLMLVMSAVPALAARPRPAHPINPPGLERSGVDRPEQAPTPTTEPVE